MHLKRKIINPFIRLPNRILRRAGYRLVESKSIPLSFYKKTYGQRAIKEHRFINIGAGAFFNHPAWANLNKTSDWYSQGSVHIEHDLISGKPLPKEIDSVLGSVAAEDIKEDTVLIRDMLSKTP